MNLHRQTVVPQQQVRRFTLNQTLTGTQKQYFLPGTKITLLLIKLLQYTSLLQNVYKVYIYFHVT